MPQGKGTYGSKVGRPPEKNSPAGYNPFQMKAGKASGHDNSPMKKNFGQFGVGTSEMPEKPTPNKFFGGIASMLGGGRKIMERLKAKRKAAAMKAQGTAAAPDPAVTEDPEVAAAEAEGAEAAEAGGGASGGDVPVHGMEAHKKSKGLGGKMFGSNAGGGMMSKMQQALGGTGGATAGVGGMGGGMFSDIRLKEKIQKTGISPSGIPIYEFNYIGSNNRYSGAMAQDLLDINPDAVMMDTSGYYKVNYNNIDVDMHQIN